MKTTTIFVLVGAFIGAAIASLVVPPALAWYTSPGGLPRGADIPAIVQIPEVIRYATTSLIRGQLIGGGIGGGAGLVLGILLRRRGKRESAPR